MRKDKRRFPIYDHFCLTVVVWVFVEAIASMARSAQITLHSMIILVLMYHFPMTGLLLRLVADDRLNDDDALHDDGLNDDERW